MRIYQESDDSYLFYETLKENLPKLIKENTNLKMLEIGCGSGIQLKAALKSGIKKKNIFSCDINPDAVNKCLKQGFNSIQSNLFEKIKDKFDLIIFNPPYLPEDKTEPEDSKIATTGGKKGSEIINKFLINAKKHLRKKGKIFILTSSLTKGINWFDYRKKLVKSKKLFFEELFIWELTLDDN